MRIEMRMEMRTPVVYVIKYSNQALFTGERIVHPKLFSSYRKAKKELLVFLDIMPEYARHLRVVSETGKSLHWYFGGKDYSVSE